MRITLWQQFSSNHSADFTVVGMFQSPEAAHKAADEIRGVLRTIQEWYKQPENAELIETFGRTDGLLPTPIEVELGKQYGIDWDEQSPDFAWYLQSDNVADAVTVFEKVVIVETDGTGQRTWSGGDVMLQLMAKLAGQSFGIDSLSLPGFDLRVTCVAPNEDVVIAIRTAHEASQNKFSRGQDTGIVVPDDVPIIYWGSGFADYVKSEGKNLNISLGGIGRLSDDLPELLDYLKNKGCSEIVYWFEETL